MATLRPQIITDKNILTSFVAPAGARTAAMIGTARWGPIDTVKTLSSLAGFVDTFGDDKSGTGVTGIKGASLFFRNGGTLKFVRVTDDTEAKADVTLQNGATDVITFTGKFDGTFGNEITVTVEANGSNRDVIINGGDLRELYSNNGTGFSTNEDIVDAINDGSALVTAAVVGGNETTNLIDATTETQLTGGADGETSITQTILETAFDDLLISPDYNFLLIPEETDDALHSSIVSRLESRESTEKKSARYLTGVDVDESISTQNARTVAGERVTVYSPNVQAQHRVDGTTLTLDGSYLACAVAGKACITDLEVSMTHETISVDALSVNTTTGQEFYTKAEQEQLLQGRIAPLSLVNDSIQVVRDVTRNTDTTSILFDGYVVDIIDDVTSSVRTYLNGVIGKPNTEDRRAIYAERIDAILGLKRREGVIESFEPSTVEEGTSPDTIIAQVNIQPTFNANFVLLTINVSS